MMAPSRQMALELPRPSAYSTESLLIGDPNHEAWAWLQRTGDWPDHRLMVCGERGCGKTHLLHVWARQAGATILRGADLAGLPDPRAAGAIAVDDADQVRDERALLHLLNACREASIPVLLTGARPPSRWEVVLPDLASRLRAIVVVTIAQPDDSFLRALLLRLLGEQGLAVSPSLPDWLLRRLPRSAAAIQDAVARLDHAALASHGPITRRLASDVLGLEGDDDDKLEKGVSETRNPLDSGSQ